jgi:hypothetical protein
MKGRRVAGPYEALPQPGDARIAAAPSRFLAVTAALSLCRRDGYLATGGMCEDYAYGFEDVDLDLKFALGSSRANICLNDAAALHAGGATRTTTISKARRHSWLANNFAVLNRRFGYALRRTILPHLFADDGSLWGRRANLALVADEGQSLYPLGEALGRAYGWNVLTHRRHDLRKVDLLLVGDPDYRLDRARHRHPMLHRLAWVLSDAAARRWRELAVYDLVVAADAALAAAVAARRETAVAILDPSSRDAAAAFFALLLDYLTHRYRFGIKETGDSNGFAGLLATELRLAGHQVRVDRPARWRCADGIRDDVAVLLPGDPICPPIPDKITLACGDAAPQAAVDARLPLGDAASLAPAILAAVARLHPLRLRGATDPPLVSRAPFAEPVVVGWESP